MGEKKKKREDGKKRKKCLVLKAVMSSFNHKLYIFVIFFRQSWQMTKSCIYLVLLHHYSHLSTQTDLNHYILKCFNEPLCMHLYVFNLYSHVQSDTVALEAQEVLGVQLVPWDLEVLQAHPPLQYLAVRGHPENPEVTRTGRQVFKLQLTAAE